MAQHTPGLLPAPPTPKLLPDPPTPKVSENAKVWGIVSIACGAVGLFILPIVFGPVALIAGIVAVNLKVTTGWWGIGLGAVQLAIVAYALNQVSEALNAL